MVILIILVLILSVFSTCVMAYISLATPIGPWVAPMLVLITSLLIRLFSYEKHYASSLIAYAVSGGSVGGIMATACSFSLPTLYFLDQKLFNTWFTSPFSAFLFVGFLCISAGFFGFFIAGLCEKKTIIIDAMPFPIGQLTYELIAIQERSKQALELLGGVLFSIIFGFLQGAFGFLKLIPEAISFMEKRVIAYFTFPTLSLRLDVFPMLLAIGFVAGHIIAIPLLVGGLSKIFIVDFLNNVFFAQVNENDFSLAFCSGIVVMGALQSLVAIPRLLKGISSIHVNLFEVFQKNTKQKIVVSQFFSAFLFIVVPIIFLSYFSFSFMNQIYVLLACALCTYQIIVIAGEIGMAQLGRFATFVMVPAMTIFGVDPMKLTITATFVELSGGIAADLLFNRKMGYAMNLNQKKLRLIQLIGLILSALFLSIIFWFIVQKFGLGSENLLAQRAQARALLLRANHFDLSILFLGALFSLILKKLRLNPMLVLGGLLMPYCYSLTLSMGGLLASWVKEKKRFEPFCSGVFAANSIMQLLKVLFA